MEAGDVRKAREHIEDFAGFLPDSIQNKHFVKSCPAYVSLGGLSVIAYVRRRVNFAILSASLSHFLRFSSSTLSLILITQSSLIRLCRTVKKNMEDCELIAAFASVSAHPRVFQIGNNNYFGDLCCSIKSFG
jgi:hypothetical protein